MSGVPAPRVLAICTANVCRSPVAELLLHRHFAAIGIDLATTSAGTHGGRGVVHPDTARAARRHGLDLGTHGSRRLTHRLLAGDGSDLVVTMAREHLYEVVALDETTWRRTFTLPELARRAAALPTPTAPVSFTEWVDALSDGRRSTDLLPGRRDDDIADPYGRPLRHHRAMVRQVDDLSRDVAVHAGRVVAPG